MLGNLVLVSVLFSFLTGCWQTEAACGYESCPETDPNLINVHLVPHSHDDVGWLKTVDEYYSGLNPSIQRANVSSILDSTIPELLKDSNRRFIYAESAFFFKWFDEQTPDMQASVRQLVNEGRLEIVGGAWSVNDEAVVHYQSVIDQFTLGLKKVSDVLGDCGRPRIGWQIDSFGHSREMASLLAQMGYDGEFFARMDFGDKLRRLENKDAEMVWQASDQLGERSELFTSALYEHYSSPFGFCFDVLCHTQISKTNAKTKVNAFLAYLTEMAKHYRTNHLLVPMGDDFNYQNATRNFENMDNLISFTNERRNDGSKFRLIYSTPSCYLKALHEANKTWPLKTQDFFPYVSDYLTVWTGFFTSRPTLKRLERHGNHFLQVAKQLTTLAGLNGERTTVALDALRHAMGIFQHHDAITGTERQRVAKDYERTLAAGMQTAEGNTQQALRLLTNLSNGEFNTSNVFATKNIHQLAVTLFNPLAFNVTQYVRLPVPMGSFEVIDDEGKPVLCQLVALPSEVLNVTTPYENAAYELIFRAQVKKLRTYFVRSSLTTMDSSKALGVIKKGKPERFLMRIPTHKIFNPILAAGGLSISNSRVTISFDHTGRLSNVTMNGVTEDVRQDFYNYHSKDSGAYVFRPTDAGNLLGGAQINVSVHEGPLVKEVHQHFNDWISQVVRIYDGEDRIEFEWQVGPIPWDGKSGSEIVTRFSTSLNTKGAMWTDSNGREMLRRDRNQREYFKPISKFELAANYYPVTTRIYMQDDAKRLTLLPDRPQGGASLRDGELELMLHRRLVRDDNLGLGEVLNEVINGRGLIVRGKLSLVLSPVNGAIGGQERVVEQQLHLPLWPFFSRQTVDTEITADKSALAIDDAFVRLPSGVNLLTLEPRAANESLLRFEHFWGVREVGGPVTFNIYDIFDALNGTEIYETTLDGNWHLDKMKRFKFRKDGANSAADLRAFHVSRHEPLHALREYGPQAFNVSLDPMQIRTFVVISQ